MRRNEDEKTDEIPGMTNFWEMKLTPDDDVPIRTVFEEYETERLINVII